MAKTPEEMTKEELLEELCDNLQTVGVYKGSRSPKEGELIMRSVSLRAEILDRIPEPSTPAPIAAQAEKKMDLDEIAKKQQMAQQDRADRDLAKKLGCDVDEMRKVSLKAFPAEQVDAARLPAGAKSIEASAGKLAKAAITSEQFIQRVNSWLKIAENNGYKSGFDEAAKHLRAASLKQETQPPRICAGCNISTPWEHRCFGPEQCDCADCKEPIAASSSPLETPAAVLKLGTVGELLERRRAYDAANPGPDPIWSEIAQHFDPETPAPADTGATEKFEDYTKEEVDAAAKEFGGIERRRQAQERIREQNNRHQVAELLASTGDTPQPQEDTQILIRNGYCPKHKIKMEFECYNMLGDGRDFCRKCDREEAARLKEILATPDAGEEKEK